MKEKVKQTMGRLRKSVRVAGVGLSTLAASFFMSAPAYAAGVEDSQIVTGTEQLIGDLTTWLMVLAPVVSGLLTVNVLLTYPQPLAVLFSEWMDNDYSFLDCIVDTMQDTVQRREKELRSCQFHVNGEPPQELKDYYELYGEELNNPDLEPAGEVER